MYLEVQNYAFEFFYVKHYCCSTSTLKKCTLLLFNTNSYYKQVLNKML